MQKKWKIHQNVLSTLPMDSTKKLPKSGFSTFGGTNTLTNDQTDSVTEKGDSRIVQ